MTQFIDLRHSSVGGGLASSVALFQATSLADYTSLRPEELTQFIEGRELLIATHGFNVDRAAAINSLSKWESLLQLPPSAAFLGLLWPGDSVWAHGLDYPDEPKIADEAGALAARFINENFAGASSISLASHSLGARVLLETVARMTLPVRRVTIMAGAIDDNCLNTEFKAAADNIGEISVLASRKDTVLSKIFPLGNFFAGIIAEGHPWWRAALGHKGPSRPRPSNFRAPFEIPDNWNFEHRNYLQIEPPSAQLLPLPFEVPPNGSPEPELDAAGNPLPGWQQAFTAGFVSTRFR
jgi:hypothetical protein